MIRLTERIKNDLAMTGRADTKTYRYVTRDMGIEEIWRIKINKLDTPDACGWENWSYVCATAATMTKMMQKAGSSPGLVAIRKTLGWSQQKMANYAETPISTYRKWEQEQRKPPEYVPRLIIRLLIAEGVLTQDQVDDILSVESRC